MHRPSLSSQYLRYAGAILGGLLILASWYQTQRDIHSLLASQKESSIHVTQTILTLIPADPSIDPDSKGLERSLATLRQNAEITSIEVFDGSGRVRSQSGSISYMLGDTIQDPLLQVATSTGSPAFLRDQHYTRVVALRKALPHTDGSFETGVRLLLPRARERAAVFQCLVRNLTVSSIFFASAMALLWLILRRMQQELLGLQDRIEAGIHDEALPPSNAISGESSREIADLRESIHRLHERTASTRRQRNLFRTRLQLALCRSRDELMECGRSGTILYATDRRKQLRSIYRYLPPEVHQPFNLAVRVAAEGRMPKPIPYSPKVGQHCVAYVFPSGDTGDRRRYRLLLQDTSAMVRLQELQLENSDLRKALSRQQTEVNGKERFLTNLSHEIRTPINSILGFCRILSNSKLDREQQEWISIMEHNGESLLALVNQVLDFSKLRNASFQINPSEFSIEALNQRLLASLQLDLADRPVALRYITPRSLPNPIRSDPGAIQQILTNLLRNSIKFTDNGSITLTAEVETAADRKNATLLLTVTDTGSGIPKDQQHRIFQAFTNIDAAKTRRFNGAGLGLSITHSLVELLSGSISFESEPGVGSIFRVKLPVELTRSTTVSETPSPSQLHGLESTSGPADLKIIVAEDNRFNQRLLQLMLQRESLQADFVNNGQDLLQALQRTPYHLVLMDLRMPEMDGIEATRLIRSGMAGIRNRQSIIIALTASTNPEDKALCYQAGMDGYLVKPFRQEALHQQLQIARDLLQPQPSGAENPSPHKATF
jgi:signal transduction histidine kinase/FixJ family two-component response regulator